MIGIHLGLTSLYKRKQNGKTNYIKCYVNNERTENGFTLQQIMLLK